MVAPFKLSPVSAPRRAATAIKISASHSKLLSPDSFILFLLRRLSTQRAPDGSNRSSAARSMRGLAQNRSKKADFELQDYVHHDPSILAPSPSSCSSNFFSTTWSNIKKPASNKQATEQRHPPSRSSVGPQSAPELTESIAHPTCRTWQQALHTENAPSQEGFVVTSFNVLASSYAHQHRSLYPHVPDVLLSWSSRKSKILKALEFSSPDIICLQEVDRFKDLAEDLALRGYVGLFKVRTGAMPDGCAIFWRKTRFQMLQERSFEFSMLGMRNNVAQLCVLEDLCGFHRRRVVVGNIHVLFNPKRGEIKLGQCRAFLEQVHNMSSIWQGAPVVICGDFNSTPASGVYEFLATSTLNLLNLDRQYLSGQTVNKTKLLRCEASSEAISEKSHVRSLNVEVPTKKEFYHTEYNYEELKATGSELKQSNWNEALSSVRQTKINVRESCFSTSKGGENIIMEERCSYSIESNIEQETSCQLVHSDNRDSSDKQFGEADKISSRMTKEVKYCPEKPKWDLEELRVATGKIDCTVMHHKLNLCSVYSEIPGQPGTRDSIGEPLLTTCHKEFTGTVDYIWRSDGLKTIKVLDTVPMDAFLKNRGLSLKLWGSDHLPISCELSFC